MQTPYHQRDIRYPHPAFVMASIYHMLRLEHSTWIRFCPLLVFKPGEHSLKIVQAFAPEAQSLYQTLKNKTEERFELTQWISSRGNLLRLLKVEPLSSIWLRSKFLPDLSGHVIWAFRVYIFSDSFKALIGNFQWHPGK